MTTKEMIANAVSRILKEEYDPGYYAHVETIRKNNTVLTGLLISCGKAAEPTVYIDDVCEKIEQGEADLEQEATKIVDFCMNKIDEDFSADVTRNVFGIKKDELLGRVFPQLINATRNMDWLKEIPHREFLDLAVIYRCKAGENGTFVVTDSLAGNLGITLEELDEHARRNAFADIHVESMNSVLGRMMGDSNVEGTPGMVVMTNNEALYGANIMLFTEPFAEIANMAGTDLIVMPSSVHEVLTIPALGIDLAEVREMVRSINASVVAKEDFLSDTVYIYHADRKCIEMS